MKASIVEMEGLLRGKCVPAKMLVNESLAQYLVRQFDDLHARADKAERERDELEKVVDVCKKESARHREARQKAEAEIARRDAESREPACYIHESQLPRIKNEHGLQAWLHCSDKKDGDMPLYIAAPPAVLPPAISTDGLDPESRDIDEVRNLAHIVGANWMRQRCLELGAQPQKPVVLPAGREFEMFHTTGFDEATYVMFMRSDEVLAALDSANIRYEVKK